MFLIKWGLYIGRAQGISTCLLFFCFFLLSYILFALHSESGSRD